jgi:hypothetical protein
MLRIPMSVVGTSRNIAGGRNTVMAGISAQGPLPTMPMGQLMGNKVGMIATRGADGNFTAQGVFRGIPKDPRGIDIAGGNPLSHPSQASSSGSQFVVNSRYR